MARVPYLNQSDLPPEHQELLARPIALNRAMANSPNASRAMSVLAMYIRHKSKLDARLRELAILQVGYLAKQPYEWSHHVKLGREQVIDLTLAIAFYNSVVRILGTLQIDVEPEYQRYLEEHPLPR